MTVLVIKEIVDVMEAGLPILTLISSIMESLLEIFILIQVQLVNVRQMVETTKYHLSDLHMAAVT